MKKLCKKLTVGILYFCFLCSVISSVSELSVPTPCGIEEWNQEYN